MWEAACFIMGKGLKNMPLREEMAFYEKPRIRYSALMALGASAAQQGREALAHYLNQADEKACKFEIIYANRTLGKTGSEADVPLLMQHADSRIRDVRESARFAIAAIRERAASSP